MKISTLSFYYLLALESSLLVVPTLSIGTSDSTTTSSSIDDGCNKPTDLLDVVVVGDLNIFSKDDSFDPVRYNCLDDPANPDPIPVNANNLALFLEAVDWVGTTDSTSCDYDELAAAGEILIDMRKSGFNRFMDGYDIQNGWANPLKLMLESTSSIGPGLPVTINPPEADPASNDLATLLATPGVYKTIIIPTPDFVGRSLPEYPCEDIEAIRNFILNGGRLVLVGDGTAASNGNAEISRILSELGSSISINTGSVANSNTADGGTVNQINSVSSAVSLQDGFCTGVGSEVTTDGGIGGPELVGTIVATYPGNIPAIVAGNIDRTIDVQTCPVVVL